MTDTVLSGAGEPAMATALPPTTLRRFHRSDVVALLLSFGAVVGAYLMARTRSPLIAGDEGHYLVFARALSHGHLDLRSVFHGPLGRPLDLGNLASDQTVRVGSHVRSIRMPLFPALLAPAMRVGSLGLVHLTTGLLGVAFLFELWQLLRDLGYGALPRWVAWLSALTALPVLVFTMQVFPEVPGALAVVVICRCLLRGSRRSLVCASVVAGLLPWLIIRFAFFGIVLAGIACAIAWRRYGRRDALLTAVPYVASLVVLVVYTKVFYGSFDPRVVYPPRFSQAWTPWHAYEVGVGSLVGDAEGLVPYAPAMLVGLIGLGVAARRFGRLGWVLLAAVVAHLFFIVPLGFWGLNMPGRFAIVLVPFFVVGIAEAVTVARGLGIVVAALIIAQLFIVGINTHIDDLIINHTPHHEYLVVFPPADQQPGLEGYVTERFTETDEANRSAEAKPVGLRPGRYAAAFTITNPATRPDTVLGQLRVIEMPSRRVIAQRTIRDSDHRPVALEFTAPGQPIQWTNSVVFAFTPSPGSGATLRKVVANPTKPLRPRIAVVHDRVWQGLAWMLAVCAGALVLLRRRRADREVV